MKQAVKLMVFGICLLLVSPAIVGAWFEKVLTKSEMVYTSFAQLLSLVPGPIGIYFRGAFYFACVQEFSWETHIGFGSVIVHRGAKVAKGVSTGLHCVIGHANIGENVRMASRISVPSGRRQHLDDEGELSPMTTYDIVTIGQDSWVGEGAIIMADVGEGSIVSAGAVVTKKMPPSSVIGGNPARVLKTLNSSAVETDNT